MRIAFVSQALHTADGVGASVRGLCAILDELGHSVAAYVDEWTSPEPSHSDTPGMQVCPIDLGSLIAAVRDGRHHPFFDHDVYIFEYPTYASILEAHRLLPGKPIVFHYHGITPPQLAAHPATRVLLERTIDRLPMLAKAHLVIVHSDFAARELGTRVPIGVERILNIPLPVDPDAFPEPTQEERTRARRRMGVEDRFVVLTVGRVAPHKQIPLIADAVGHARATVPSVQLLVAGDDARHGYRAIRAETLRRARARGVTNAVRFLGRIDQPHLRDAYAAADVLVSASLHEGFCVPVAEALTSGLPVIAARSTALPQTAGGAGLFFAPGDARDLADQIVRLAGDAALQRELRQRARLESLRFDPGAIAPQVAAALARARSARAPCELVGPAIRPEPDLLGAAGALEVTMPGPVMGPIHRRALDWLRGVLTRRLVRLVIAPLQANLQLTAELAAAENARLRERIAKLEERLRCLENRPEPGDVSRDATGRRASAPPVPPEVHGTSRD